MVVSLEMRTALVEIPRSRFLGLAVEFTAIFLMTTVILSFHATRLNIHLALWVIGLYGVFLMSRSNGFSWRDLWEGDGWPVEQRKIAVLRFYAATAVIIGLTCALAPSRLFSFPMQRPFFWLVVMFLYPVFSVVPQEFVLRSFFFWRYRQLFSKRWMLIIASGFCFGLVHIVLGNPVAPVLSALGGGIFAHSYARHRSLKWAALEHAAYGCMVFTVGLGSYFLVGRLNRP